MSSLVPHNNPSSFTQQGTVDWVTLYNSTVQCSVAVLARLSKAGIDQYTLQVGRAICLNFSLGPQSQERILTAIQRLRKYGSYDRVIWFGFGIKQILTDLSETEQGLTLVALIAALSVTYDPLFTAQVLRELCSLGKPTEAFTPALRQWRMLVDLCAGILTSVDFIHFLNGFRRLMLPHFDDNKKRPASGATPASTLAMAILALGKVSKHSLHSITIVGGLDCAWLAAFADWVLLLDVGILDPNGSPLYRSRKGNHGAPQIVFKIHEDGFLQVGRDLVTSKRFIIDSGQTLFCRIDDNQKGRSLRFQASWETILRDTFSESIDLLTHEKTNHGLAYYLYCASSCQKPDLRYQEADFAYDNSFVSERNPIDQLLWTRKESRGLQFIEFAAKRLPELQTCLQVDFSTIPSYNLDALGQNALKGIERVCTCYKHPSRSKGNLPEQWCLNLIAQTILVYLWIAVASDIDDDVCPSIDGLKLLYRRQVKGRVPGRSFPTNPTLTTFGDLGLSLVFAVFSGSRFIETATSSSMSQEDSENSFLALSGGGICVYRKILEDPMLSPDLIFKLRVIRGCISHSGSQFKAVKSLKKDATYRSQRDKSNPFLEGGIQTTVTTVVEDNFDAFLLNVGYQVVYSTRTSDTASLWLNPEILLDTLRSVTETWSCLGSCQPLNMMDRVPTGHYFWRRSSDWAIKIDPESIEIAQGMLKQVREPAEKWILTNSAFGNSSYIPYHFPTSHIPFHFPTSQGSFAIIIDKPFILYLCLMHRSALDLALFPYNVCLSCSIELGCWAKFYPSFEPNILNTTKGVVNLITPDKNVATVRWELKESASGRLPEADDVHARYRNRSLSRGASGEGSTDKEDDDKHEEVGEENSNDENYSNSKKWGKRRADEKNVSDHEE